MREYCRRLFISFLPIVQYLLVVEHSKRTSDDDIYGQMGKEDEEIPGANTLWQSESSPLSREVG